MSWNRFFVSLFVLSLAPLVTAQTPVLDSGASANIDFSTAQKQAVYQSITKTQKNNAAPQGFRAAVGGLVPNGVELAPVPKTIAELMPQTKGLEAAVVEGEVILVEPQGKKIVAVVTPPPQP
jgi:uncharacterized protein DUF1236